VTRKDVGEKNKFIRDWPLDSKSDFSTCTQPLTEMSTGKIKKKKVSGE
jgi:hypothetical protein